MKLAYSSLCCRYIDDILSLANSSPYKGLEWDMNFIPPTLSRSRSEGIQAYLKSNNITIRYHLPYSFIEIAHFNRDIQNFSIVTVKRYLDFIKQLSGQYAIIHVGYVEGCDETAALNAIKDLASYAKRLGISLCVENLIKGLSTKIDFLKRALEIDNVFLCLDTGHAQVVSLSQDSFLSELTPLLEKCVHAHVYMTEDHNYNHIAFEDLQSIAESVVIKSLLKSNCDWCTMELDDRHKQEKQMRILEGLYSSQQIF